MISFLELKLAYSHKTQRADVDIYDYSLTTCWYVYWYFLQIGLSEQTSNNSLQNLEIVR